MQHWPDAVCIANIDPGTFQECCLLQESWELMFDTVDTTHDCVRIATGVISTLKIFPDKMLAGLSPDMLATDLAEYLVRKGAHVAMSQCCVSIMPRWLHTRQGDLQGDDMLTVQTCWELTWESSRRAEPYSPRIVQACHSGRHTTSAAPQ